MIYYICFVDIIQTFEIKRDRKWQVKYGQNTARK